MPFCRRINVRTKTGLKALGSRTASKFLYCGKAALVTQSSLKNVGDAILLQEFAFITNRELISFITDLSHTSVTVFFCLRLLHFPEICAFKAGVLKKIPLWCFPTETSPTSHVKLHSTEKKTQIVCSYFLAEERVRDVRGHYFSRRL